MGSGKVDNSTDKLRDHVCDKGRGENEGAQRLRQKLTVIYKRGKENIRMSQSQCHARTSSC